MSSALWEVTFLHRPRPGRGPRVAGRSRIDAPSATRARDVAREDLARRAGAEQGWSIGVLCPLAPGLPGTFLYRVTFARWVEDGSGYHREDVHELEVWATDATSARRLAARQAAVLPEYEGAWRVRGVRRVPDAGRGARLVGFA